MFYLGLFMCVVTVGFMVLQYMLRPLYNFIMRSDVEGWCFFSWVEEQDTYIVVAVGLSAMVQAITLYIVLMEFLVNNTLPDEIFVTNGWCMAVILTVTLLPLFLRWVADVCKGLKYKSSNGKLDELEQLKQRISELENK